MPDTPTARRARRPAERTGTGADGPVGRLTTAGTGTDRLMGVRTLTPLDTTAC